MEVMARWYTSFLKPHHADEGVDEGEGQQGVTGDGGRDGQEDAEDVAAQLVDQQAEEGRRHRRDDVHDAVDGVGLRRCQVKLALEEDPATETTTTFISLQPTHPCRLCETLGRKLGWDGNTESSGTTWGAC